MNILSTGVKAMMMAFQGNNDKEQLTRLTKLDKLGRVKMIRSEDLNPQKFARQIVSYLQQQPTELSLNLNGVDNTAKYLKQLAEKDSSEKQQLATLIN